MVEATSTSQQASNRGPSLDSEFFMGMPVSAFFQADIKLAIVIGCSEYGELRKLEGKGGFSNIEEAMDDIKVVQAGLRRLQFRRKEILVLNNPTYMEIKKAIDNASATIYETY